MLGRAVGHAVGRLVVALAYPVGLTLLLTLPALLVLPPELAGGRMTRAPLWGGAAVVLVATSLLVSVTYTHSLAGSLKTLGRLTFVPGLLGLAVSILGRDAALAYAARTLPRFGEVEPLLVLYLDRAVPPLRYLTVGFLGVGALLMLAGDRLGRRQSRDA